MQRARSYGEMAKLLGIMDEFSIPGLGTVCAITSAYQMEVMDDRRDAEKISDKLRSTGDHEDWLLADQADRGMGKIRQIPQDGMILEESIDLAQIYEDCRNIYSQAYDWQAPSDFKSNETWRVRQHIKHWINAWDLERLFPEHESQLQVTALEPSYAKVPAEEAEPVAKVNSCVVEGARPRFALFGGQETYEERITAPGTQTYISLISTHMGKVGFLLCYQSTQAFEWRWRVHGFDMPWQWVDEQKLRQKTLVREFGKEQVGVSGGKWEHLEEDQLGIELQFQLDGDWLRELHRFPLTRQVLVDGRELWKIGLEIMPPVTYRLLRQPAGTELPREPKQSGYIVPGTPGVSL